MNSLEKSRIDEIVTLHSEIFCHLKMSLDKGIRIGELLIEQKDNLEHGQFEQWVEGNLPFTARTARNYMRLHKERDRLRTETVSDLTSAYRLLAEPKEFDARGKLEKLKELQVTIEKELRLAMKDVSPEVSPGLIETCASLARHGTYGKLCYELLDYCDEATEEKLSICVEVVKIATSVAQAAAEFHIHTGREFGKVLIEYQCTINETIRDLNAHWSDEAVNHIKDKGWTEEVFRIVKERLPESEFYCDFLKQRFSGKSVANIVKGWVPPEFRKAFVYDVIQLQ